MSFKRVFKRVLGVEPGVVIEGLELAERRRGEVLFVDVRLHAARLPRCSRCGKWAPGYDQGAGTRMWRHLDFGAVRVFLRARQSRVACKEHGVVAALVPWARPGSRFTRFFEDQTAWLAKHAPLSAVAELMRTTWKSVQAIITRVVAEAAGKRDMLKGLRRIGIDEIAFRKGHRYLTIVIDHDTGRIVWAAEGRSKATLEAFFTDLGKKRAKKLTHVSADGAEWIHAVVRAKAPKAKACIDAFYVTAWANDAVDEVRRAQWRQLAKTDKDEAAWIKDSRWALLKNPENLSGKQRTKLSQIEVHNDKLYRAYLLKEQLRAAFAAKGEQGKALIAGWLAWASRSRLAPFVKLARTIRHYLPLIRNTMDEGQSNGRTEATNSHLRALTKRAYGFHSPDALIAMALLTRGGLCPPLPGRN